MGKTGKMLPPTNVDTAVCSDHESRIGDHLTRLAAQGSPHPHSGDFFDPVGYGGARDAQAFCKNVGGPRQLYCVDKR